MEQPLPPSPPGPCPAEALEGAAPLLEVDSKTLWVATDGTPSPPASPAAAAAPAAAASPLTPEGTARPPPQLPFSGPTSYYAQERLQMQAALLADTDVIQDLMAEKRSLEKALAALAQAKLQQAGPAPSFSGALAGAAHSAAQLPGGLLAAVICLLGVAWRACATACTTAGHTVLSACTAIWWAWACRGWALRWLAACAAHAAAPLVNWATCAAISTAQHTLRFAAAGLHSGKRFCQHASSVAQRSAVAAGACALSWALAASCMAAIAFAAARRWAAAAHQSATAACTAAQRAGKVVCQAASQRATTAAQLMVSFVKARPRSCLAAALLAAFLLGRLTASDLPPATTIAGMPPLDANGTCTFRPEHRYRTLSSPPPTAPTTPAGSAFSSHLHPPAAVIPAAATHPPATQQPAASAHPPAAPPTGRCMAPTRLPNATVYAPHSPPTPTHQPNAPQHTPLPPILELAPVPRSTLFFEPGSWLVFHPSVHAMLDFAESTTALAQSLASNGTSLPAAGVHLIFPLLAKAWAAVPAAQWIAPTAAGWAVGQGAVWVFRRQT